MTAFVETTGGRYIRLDTITQAVPKEDGGKVTVFTGGEYIGAYEVYQSVWDDALKSTHPIIPAEPDHYVLWPQNSLEDMTVEMMEKLREPILGWRAVEGGTLEPLLLESGPSEPIIQYPSGRVVDPENRFWDTLEEFVKDRREELEAKLKKSA